MKKVISFILLFVLAFNTVFTGVTVKAESAGETEEIVVGEGDDDTEFRTLTATEEENGSASSAILYLQMMTGMPTEIDITTAGQEVYCRFVPEQSGTYKFHAESDGEYTCAWLYDSDFQEIAEGDYPDWDYVDSAADFEIIADLTAGETYYLKTCFGYSYSVGSYDITPVLLKKATSMEIANGEAITCYLGKEILLTVLFNPVGESIKESVTWSSLNENVATVSSLGWVSGVGVGTTTITAESAGGFVQSIEVTVCDVIPEIRVGEEKFVTSSQRVGCQYYKFTPDKNATYAFTSKGNESAITPIVENSLGGEYAWPYGDVYWATRSDDFTIVENFVAGETYYLRIDFFETVAKSFSVSVKEVTQQATSVEILAKDKIVGRAGSSTILFYTLQPAICIPEYVSWSERDKSIVSTTTLVAVDENRYGCSVNFVAPGTTNLTITTDNGLTDSVEIVVKDEEMLSCEVGMDYTYQMLEAEEYFEFVPEKSGMYKFSAYNASYNSYIYVLDKDYNSLALSKNEVTYRFMEGETYYFKLQGQLYGPGCFDLKLVESYGSGSSPSTDGYYELSTEEYTYIDVEQQGDERWCEFIPKESGIYMFTTNSGGWDTKAYLYDSDYTELTSNDDTVSEADLDFTILYELQAGETYYLAVHYLSDEENRLWLKPRKITDVTDMHDDTDVDVEIKMLTEGYEEKVLRFIPQETGTYFFESELVEGYPYIFGRVYDAQFNIMAQDPGFDNGFGFSVNLNANETYYLYTSIEDRTANWESSYRVCITKMTTVLHGDVDGNGAFNRDDAIYLLYHVMLPSKYPVNQNVDFDGNGYVTSDDAIYLLNNPITPDDDGNEGAGSEGSGGNIGENTGSNVGGNTGGSGTGGNTGESNTGDGSNGGNAGGSSGGNVDDGSFGGFF